MEKNGTHASSMLILLCLHVLRTMPKSALSALMNTIGYGRKQTSATEFLEKLLYLDTVKNLRIDRREAEFGVNMPKVKNYLTALNELPFTLKTLTRHHMVRESGWISGRSKQVETEVRKEKNGGELVDGIRNFCLNCDTWLPWLGLDAMAGQSCKNCGQIGVQRVREIAVTDRYQPTINIPWIFDGAITEKLYATELRTMGGDPFSAVVDAMNRFDWRDIKVWRSNTNKRHKGHGVDERGMKQGRIYGLVCRIPVKLDGETVALWANVPCDSKGDIRAGQRFNGLIEAQIKVIEDFNTDLMARSQVFSLIQEKRNKFTDVDDSMVNECLEMYRKRLPAAKSWSAKVAARMYDLKNKVIKT